MKKLTFWPGIYITSNQRTEHRESLKYLDNEKSAASLGCKSILLYLIKQEDIWKIETEVSFCDDNKRLRTDIAFYFTNGAKGVIEFNGTQHFVWSSWYPNKASFTKQNESLIHKELTCMQLGYSCLNFNDLTYLDIPVMEEEAGDPYTKLRKVVAWNYSKFFEALRNGNCPKFRDILNRMKSEVTMVSYNLKLKNRDWRNGFRTSLNKDLDQILFNMCNDDTYTTYI